MQAAGHKTLPYEDLKVAWDKPPPCSATLLVRLKAYKRTKAMNRVTWFRKQKEGQSLVLIALMMVAILGMLALAIDAGTLWGQRRFMQNGADSASLAAATLLADNVGEYATPHAIPIYFQVTDGQVRTLVSEYVTENQNVGLATRTSSNGFDLEYFVTVNGSYNNNMNDLVNNRWVASPTADGRVPDGAYRVRVTAHTNLENWVASIIGHPTTEVNAEAVAALYGVQSPPSMTGWLWPLTMWDHTDIGNGQVYDFAAQDPNTMYTLWGPNAEYKYKGKSVNMGSYKNYYDFSPSSAWDDNNAADYGFPAPHPDGGNHSDWNRSGFSPDPVRPGSVNSVPDLARWVAYFFQGTVRVGNQMPVYNSTVPGQQGNLGKNISEAIWGKTDPDVGTYFFADPNQCAIDPAHPSWGPYRVVVIALWNYPEWWDKKNDKWLDASDKDAKGPPDRVQITKFHFFKIYRDYKHSASSVDGMWKSGVVPPTGPGPVDPPPPSSWFNSVKLVQ